MKRIAGAWETKWKKYLTWEIVSTTDANYYERPSSYNIHIFNFYEIIQGFLFEIYPSPLESTHGVLMRFYFYHYF